MAESFAARRVFFVNPPSVVQDQIIDVLIRAEYEIAIIKDYRWIFPLMIRYPRSIFYLNFEYHISDRDRNWDWVIDRIRDDQDQHGSSVGIIGYNITPEDTNHFVMEKSVECGCVQLRLGTIESAKILLKSLELSEARGRRKFVRVRAPEGKSSLTLKTPNGLRTGHLLDLSSAGFAVVFENGDIDLSPGTSLDDIQLRLWGSVVGGIAGKVVGRRSAENGSLIHVVLFEPKIQGEQKSKIHGFIRRVLQYETERSAQ